MVTVLLLLLPVGQRRSQQGVDRRVFSAEVGIRGEAVLDVQVVGVLEDLHGSGCLDDSQL